MKYILLISLLIVNVKAITYNEIFGTWYISSLYDNKKVFFSGEFNKNITINLYYPNMSRQLSVKFNSLPNL